MDLKIGSRTLREVTVPVIWGNRAVALAGDGKLSVVDYLSDPARLEILTDQPAPGVNFVPVSGGFRILSFRSGMYDYIPADKTLKSPTDELPECQIERGFVRVGTRTFPLDSDYFSSQCLQVLSSEVRILDRLPSALDSLVIGAVPNPDIPEHTFILSGTSILGDPVKVARGVCECNASVDRSKEFFLESGDRWTCPDCGNHYSFDGDRIRVTRPITGTTPSDGSILAIVSKDGASWTRDSAHELDQIVTQSVRRFGSRHIFVWVPQDFWQTQLSNTRFNSNLPRPGVEVELQEQSQDKVYVFFRADPNRNPVTG